jgi:cell wall-associated NlpC family hydrolase
MNYSAVNDIIGTPWVYKENDCYAVVKKGLKDVFGIEIYDVEIPKTSNRADNISLFSLHSKKSEWFEVDTPEPGDVVLFYDKNGHPFHIGLYIQKGSVLHCWGTEKIKGSTVIEKLSRMSKAFYTKSKFFRYADNSNTRPVRDCT